MDVSVHLHGVNENGNCSSGLTEPAGDFASGGNYFARQRFHQLFFDQDRRTKRR